MCTLDTEPLKMADGVVDLCIVENVSAGKVGDESLDPSILKLNWYSTGMVRFNSGCQTLFGSSVVGEGPL